MKFLRFERVVRMSVKNLTQYKMRASLTVLGIVFGVCSVVAMLSVGEGASQEIQEQIRLRGSNNILIKSVKLPEEQLSGGQSTTQSRVANYGITYDDAERIARFVPDLKSLTPLKSVRQDIRYRENKVETRLVATRPWYPDVTNHRMLAGRFFTKKDAEMATPVCIIGARLARNLFPAIDPLGKIMRIEEDIYRVIGVIGDVYSTREFENTPLWFVGSNPDVFIPLESWRKRNGDLFVKRSGGSSIYERVHLHELILNIENQENVMMAADRVRDILAQYHDRMDYEIEVPLQLIQDAKDSQRIFNIVLGVIAAISLLVGGIGIMNIMLATVSERTREIGIRRAMGAHRSDIVQQFLIETLVLSISGGVIGMILGAVIPMLVTAFTDLKTVLTPISFIVAFSVSVFVGLTFGIYPARRAARMDPIEALRHE